jgi:hypothetical protein
MFIIILDLQFKSLEVVKKMVGHGDAIQVEEAKYFEDLDVHGDSCCTSIQLSHFYFSSIFSSK